MAYLGYTETTDLSGRTVKVEPLTSGKACCACGEWKEYSQYPLKGRGYLHTECKKCRRLSQNMRYAEKALAVSNYKREVGCILCGYSEPCALDFHHRDGSDKSFTIGKEVSSSSLQKLFEEINKCVVLCANCHREVHAGLRVIEGGDANVHI